MTTTALAQSTKQDVIDTLSAQGFSRISVSKTLFGNTRFQAKGAGVEREIVLGKNGTIMRDRTEHDDETDDDETDVEDDAEDDSENDGGEGDDGVDDGEGDDGGDDGEGDD
ncbi:MAG: hypothetical protein ACU0BK_09515 [Shimia sp.]|uniref:hypothetical protein n=1 Tax=Shimia sp. TaxID=1954381 RepID=UPI004057EECA